VVGDWRELWRERCAARHTVKPCRQVDHQKACAAAQPTTTTATTTTIPTRAPPAKTCYSVGDPHLKKFDGTAFDSHATGWKTLYAKGDLKIDLEQATWRTTGGVAINRAVRYSTDGGNTWDEILQDGQLLSSGATKQFVNPNVKLTVGSADYSQYAWASIPHIYNVYVTTNEYDGATGQCSQGRLRRRLESSDGVSFPSGDDVKVSREVAEEACAGLAEQQSNCVTDMRMINEPDAVDKIKEDFETVESTVTALEATTTAPAMAATTESTEDVVTSDSSTMMHVCVSTLALASLLVV